MSIQSTNSQSSSSAFQTRLPQGAFDTHVHVFDPRLGPYAAGRAYTPEDAPLQELLAFNNAISGANNTTLVLVQPSPYKTDCTVLMQCLRELRDREIPAFGIAVIDISRVTDQELQAMHDLGIRGIRLNFQADGHRVDVASLKDRVRHAAERIQHLPGWMIQMFIPVSAWDVLYDCILELPVPIIADHLGGTAGPSKLPVELRSKPMAQPGLGSLLSLARQARVIIKISGLYRMSSETSSNYGDLQSIVKMLASEVPDQLIWGSDWPHTGEGHDRVGKTVDVKEPFREIDNQGVLRNLSAWMGPGAWQKMMVENPRRVYQG
ncbi:amidohydrolase 2 [Aspergillus fijiensis CBS 313.89]|uniref:Amidohydrolase 2 n=1 Tax=Aspergillus fijiensis CBS 313.89 TaxID=1448319 RepID=A0A8G1RZ47_9EURO|nr:amidohydrolase 2 [Aspergillus fijiensis CBS 313.89]RAK79446.1 amidohydrolase 2 [Aspergillus fijiensis CBS 313.89]